MAIYEYYTDGAASMKKKNGEYIREAGGWAFAQVKDDTIIFSKSGHEEKTTNQAMELRAIYEALNHYYKHYYSPNIADEVKIYSDSAYSINIYTQWAKGWEAKGWTRGKGQKIENLEIIRKTWELLKILNSGFNSVSFVKVIGHSGNPCNEYVDRLAVAAKKGSLLGRDGTLAGFTAYDDVSPTPGEENYFLPIKRLNKTATKGKRPLCSVIDDIGPDREQVSEVIKGKRMENFDYLVQISAEEHFSIIEEVLNETLKPFINFNFKPKEDDNLIYLTSEWVTNKKSASEWKLKEED